MLKGFAYKKGMLRTDPIVKANNLWIKTMNVSKVLKKIHGLINNGLVWKDAIDLETV